VETTHLILVRHGESLHNRGDVSADADGGLTELGWRQSQWVADWLARSYKPDILLSSTLTRARQTAAMIGRRLRLPVQLQPGIEEATQSYWTELPPAHQAGPFALWDEAWLPTAENAPVYSAFRADLRRALEEILAAHAGKTIVAVTHGGAVGTLLRSLFGGHYLPVFTQNTGVTHIAWKDGHWQLFVHNLHEHLAQVAAPRAAVADPQPPFPWGKNGATQAAQDHYRRIALAGCDLEDAEEGDIAALVALASVPPSGVVLDAGTGSGPVALAFARSAGRVIGVDVSPAMLERAEIARSKGAAGNVELFWADATELPAGDRSADIVASRNLWQHLADPALYVREAARVLKPDGRLVLDELIGSEDPVKRATQEAIEVRRDPSFTRLPTQEEIERLLAEGGFRLEKALPYEVSRDVDAWLACAATDESTRNEVHNMLETGMDTDAAGLRVKRNRDGGLVFTRRRLRLAARPGERSAI
jgi:broad specificity phosphatase PhoE/ubiquinone/menaquinone biosynthesis C-methylase UbiE